MDNPDFNDTFTNAVAVYEQHVVNKFGYEPAFDADIDKNVTAMNLTEKDEILVARKLPL